MSWVKMTLLGLVVSVNAMAELPIVDEDVEITEPVRIQKLVEAKTIEEAIDLMTPAELEVLYGVPADSLYQPIAMPLVQIHVSLSQQSLTLTSPTDSFSTLVSTGVKGHRTPRGCHTAKWLSKDHKSSLYNNAPMPNAVFFNGHIAIHGTFAERALGAPASHGCVRVSRAVSSRIFRIVSQYGVNRVSVCVGR